MINKTDGLRKEFDLDVISLKEDSLEKVNSELSGACSDIHCPHYSFMIAVCSALLFGCSNRTICGSVEDQN